MFQGLHNGKPLGAEEESPDKALQNIRYIRDNCPYDISSSLAVKDMSTGQITVVLPPMKKEKIEKKGNK